VSARHGREAFEERLLPVIRPYLNRPVAWDELGDIGSYFSLFSVVYVLATATGDTELRDQASGLVSRALAAPDVDRDPYWLNEQTHEDMQLCMQMLDWFAPRGWYFGFLGDNAALGYWPIPENEKKRRG